MRKKAWKRFFSGGLMMGIFLLFVQADVLAAQKTVLPAEMRLEQHVIHDSQANLKAMVAVTPQGWKFQGQAVWDMQSIVYPARVSFQVNGPSDGAGVVYAPMENYDFVQPDITGTPAGQRRNGIIRMPPAPADQYIQAKFREIRPMAANVAVKKNHKPKWLIETFEQSVKPFREDFAKSGLQGQVTYDLAEIVFEYTENGKRYEERMYTGIIYTSMVIPSQMRPVYTTWLTAGIFCSRAYTGKYEAHKLDFEIIEQNSQADLRWMTAMLTVGQKLVKNEIGNIKARGEIQRQMTQASKSLTASTRDVIRERQASMDRISQKRSDVMMGVERYETSEGNVALPTGYKYGWERKSGEIILNDNPLFDPNVGDAGQWNKIEKAW